MDNDKELRELSKKATPGPWEYSHWRSNRETYTRHGIGNSVARGQVLMAQSTASGDKLDWQFIVACVNHVREQLAAGRAAAPVGQVSEEQVRTAIEKNAGFEHGFFTCDYKQVTAFLNALLRSQPAPQKLAGESSPVPKEASQSTSSSGTFIEPPAPAVQVSEEQVREVVKDAVKMAIVRNDLLDGVDDTISDAEEVAEDTWLAMNGIGTCEEGRLPSLNALLRSAPAPTKRQIECDAILNLMGKEPYLAKGHVEDGEFKWLVVADKISVTELRGHAEPPAVREAGKEHDEKP